MSHAFWERKLLFDTETTVTGQSKVRQECVLQSYLLPNDKQQHSFELTWQLSSDVDGCGYSVVCRELANVQVTSKKYGRHFSPNWRIEDWPQWVTATSNLFFTATGSPMTWEFHKLGRAQPHGAGQYFQIQRLTSFPGDTFSNLSRWAVWFVALLFGRDRVWSLSVSFYYP